MTHSIGRTKLRSISINVKAAGELCCKHINRKGRDVVAKLEKSKRSVEQNKRKKKGKKDLSEANMSKKELP